MSPSIALVADGGRPGDAVRIDALARQAGGAGIRAVVTGDVLYHAPAARLLQDVVTAVREKCTVDELGYRREVNADRALKSPEEMIRRFRAYPDALQASVDIARACTFDLGELAYQYPHERLIDGLTAQEALEQLATDAVNQMFDAEVPEAYTNQIAHELKLIEELGYSQERCHQVRAPARRSAGDPLGAALPVAALPRKVAAHLLLGRRGPGE